MVWNGERRTRRNEGGIIYISVLTCRRGRRVYKSGTIGFGAIDFVIYDIQASEKDWQSPEELRFNRFHVRSNFSFRDLLAIFFSFLKKETKSFEQSGVFHRMFRKEENLSHSSSLESNKITSFRFARLKMDLKKTRLSKNNNQLISGKFDAEMTSKQRKNTRKVNEVGSKVENCFHPIKIRACARAKHDKLSTMQISTVHKSRNGPLHRRPLVLSVSS